MDESKRKDECDKLISNIKLLIKNLKSKLDSDDPVQEHLENVQNKLRLAGYKPYDYIMRRVAGKLWMYKDNVVKRDEKTLFSDDFGKDFIKKDQRQKMIEQLLKTVKFTFRTATDKEKDEVWTILKDIIRSVAVFVKTLEIDDAKQVLSTVQVDDDDDF
jgi:hypothetical protein